MFFEHLKQFGAAFRIPDICRIDHRAVFTLQQIRQSIWRHFRFVIIEFFRMDHQGTPEVDQQKAEGEAHP
jgi:hypothetical protein